MQAHIDKINEMASVMRKAIEVDEGGICEDEERIKQLEVRKHVPPYFYMHFQQLSTNTCWWVLLHKTQNPKHLINTCLFSLTNTAHEIQEKSSLVRVTLLNR